MDPRFFKVSMCWLTVLIGVAAAYAFWPAFRHALPSHFGPIPVTAPWFGAIGGWLMSFGGIVQHNQDWDPRFNYWHPVKPILGLVMGSVACVLILALLAAAGGLKNHNPPYLFDAGAFVFGYAENAFRELIEEVTNVILKPGSKG